MTNSATAENPLWDWSLRVYAKPGVAESCLSLQEDYGADVNMLLLGAYLAAQQQCWDQGTLTVCLAAVDAWRRQVVLPLRAARHAARRLAPAADLQAQLRNAELGAERHQQDLLWAAIVARPPARCDNDALTHNLSLLAGGNLADPPWQRLLAALRSQ